MASDRLLVARVIADKADSMSEKQLSEEVAAYLLESGRINEIDPLMRDVMMIRSEKGVIEATAESAHELDSKAIAEIKTVIKGLFPGSHNIIVKNQVNKDLIGGVRVNALGQQIDFSIRAKLNHFKRLTLNKGKVM